MARNGTADDDGIAAVLPYQPRVLELRDAQFRQCHMECLRRYIALSLLHAQRERMRLRGTNQSESDDDQDVRDEFEIELVNLHALLTNRYLDDIDVLVRARRSIEQYVSFWSADTAVALDRWWAPRRDKHAAVWADLQLVIPGVWIGSTVTTLKPSHTELLVQKRIRHIVHCGATPVDTDDDFVHGAERALTSLEAVAKTYPTVESLGKLGAQQHHRITLFQLGHMEFLVRRRDNALPAAVASEAIRTVAGFVQRLLRGLQDAQYAQLDGDQLVDTFDGILLCCETGTTVSIVVCVALLMAELGVGVDVAKRLVMCARPHAAPTAFFEHALREYEPHVSFSPPPKKFEY